LVVSQQQWAVNVHAIFNQAKVSNNSVKLLHEFNERLVKNLSDLASVARTKIPSLTRKVLCALITIDVHAKDTISQLIETEVSSG
jgi:dynein heavy chain